MLLCWKKNMHDKFEFSSSSQWPAICLEARSWGFSQQEHHPYYQPWCWYYCAVRLFMSQTQVMLFLILYQGVFLPDLLMAQSKMKRSWCSVLVSTEAGLIRVSKIFQMYTSTNLRIIVSNHYLCFFTCICLLVGRLVGLYKYPVITDQISMKHGWQTGLGPETRI